MVKSHWPLPLIVSDDVVGRAPHLLAEVPQVGSVPAQMSLRVREASGPQDGDHSDHELQVHAHVQAMLTRGCSSVGEGAWPQNLGL